MDSTILNQITTKNVLCFIEIHCPLLYEKMIKEIVSEDGIYLEADCEDWLYKNCKNEFGDGFNNADEWENGKYHLIASVMEKETGITFYFVNGDDPDVCNNEAILLSACMPWEYLTMEHELTAQKLTDIFKIYFSDLGVNAVPSAVEVFFYG